MSCVTVVKRPWYKQLIINPSYCIVLYYVLMLFVYYGGPPTAMNSFLSIIANSGRAIFLVYREGVGINIFLIHLIILHQTLRWRPRPNPSEEAPRGGVCSSMETKPLALNGKRAHHGGDVCVMCFPSSGMV